jgi:ribulose-phosphate 3-epimerase
MATVFEQLRAAAPTISVGLLTADLMHLADEIESIRSSGVSVVHFDVMDGRFCPALTMGTALVKGTKTDLIKDVHLMIEDPLDHLAAFVKAGADMVSVSVESTRHIHRALQALREMENANDPQRGIVRGVCLNPGTPVNVVNSLMDDVEMVVLLAVNPGWSGQKFIPDTVRRIEAVREMIAASGKDILLCVDGGIKKQNIAEVAQLGVDLVVTGSAVFDGKDPAGNARFMLDETKGKKKP